MNLDTSNQSNLENASVAPPENVTVTSAHPINQITSFSKYLAMTLFIILPFLGGYVGYKMAPEKVIEMDKSTYNNFEDKINLATQELHEDINTENVVQSVNLMEDSLSDSEIISYECISEVNSYPHVCFSYKSKTSALEIENLTSEAQRQEVISGRTTLGDLVYKTTDSRKIYFTAGIPESDGCCRLLAFNKDTLKFNIVDAYLGLGASFGSNDARYIATVEDSDTLYILDLENEKIISRTNIAHDSLMSSKCGFAGPVYDLKYNASKNGFDYGIYSSSTVITDECQQEKISTGFLPIE